MPVMVTRRDRAAARGHQRATRLTRTGSGSEVGAVLDPPCLPRRRPRRAPAAACRDPRVAGPTRGGTGRGPRRRGTQPEAVAAQELTRRLQAGADRPAERRVEAGVALAPRLVAGDRRRGDRGRRLGRADAPPAARDRDRSGPVRARGRPRLRARGRAAGRCRACRGSRRTAEGDPRDARDDPTGVAARHRRRRPRPRRRAAGRREAGVRGRSAPWSCAPATPAVCAPP